MKLWLIFIVVQQKLGFPGGASGEEPSANAGDVRTLARIQCLGREDPLEEDTATHSSVLAWRAPWTEEPGRLHGAAESQTRLK